MRYWIIFLLFPLFALSTDYSSPLNEAAKKKDKTELSGKGPDYTADWKKVEALQTQGKPASARALVEKILERARKENNYPQQIKAIQYIMKYRDQVEEDAATKNIAYLDSQIQLMPPPARNILLSLQAENYWNYYQNNRYVILSRTPSPSRGPDISVWDAADFEDTVKSLYLASLSPMDALVKTPVRSYQAILDTQSRSEIFRPSLYDLLAFRAIDFLGNSESTLSRAAEKNTLDSLTAFVPTAAFMQMDLAKATGLEKDNNLVLALQLYQQLLRLHKNDKSQDAFVNDELQRLLFARQITLHEKKDSIYYQRLLDLEKQYQNSPLSALAAYQRASLIHDGYNPPDRKAGLSLPAMAVEICETYIKQFPRSIYIQNLAYLKKEIQLKELAFMVENQQLPGRAIQVWVKWKNIDKAFYRVVKLSEKQEESINLYGDQLTKYLLSQRPVKSGNWALLDKKDYLSLSADQALPALGFGSYYLLLSTDSSFNKKQGTVVYNQFRVSGMKLLQETQNDGSSLFYLLKAASGDPVKDAEVKVVISNYNNRSRSYSDSLIQTLHTDANGSFTVGRTPNYNSAALIISNGQEQLRLDVSIYNEPGEQDSESKTTHIFTDRSIYRPGQTVFFKGILLKSNLRDRNFTTYSIVPKQALTVGLYDVNDQKISDLKVVTNDFGSYSGSFALPTGLLNGSFSIRDEYGQAYIQVEEYKRPTFEVKLDTPGAAYKLDDKVQVSGRAASYSGVALAGAKVNYRVMRGARLFGLQWWIPWPYIPQIEVASGTATTDANGRFNLSFYARADESLSAELPNTYSFTITADVTDITGETQSGSLSLNIGNNALETSIQFPDWLNKQEALKYRVQVENMNGQPVNVKGRLLIQQLDEPDRLIRSRLLVEADTQLLSKAAFTALFPHDAYRNEDKAYNYPVLKTWIEQDVNSNQDISLSTDQLKNLPQGWYRASFDTKDTFGKVITTIQYFKVFDPSSRLAAVKSYSYLIPLHTEQVQPGEKASFIWGSATKARAHITADHNGTILYDKWVEVNNSQEKIEIPITEASRGTVFVKVFSVNENRTFNLSQNIGVPYKNTQLSITPGVFHSTLKPGQKETWQFLIKGPNAEKVSAEMMATLYDASLDAFRPHSWDFTLEQRNFSGIYQSIQNDASPIESYTLYDNQEINLDEMYNQRYDEILIPGRYRDVVLNFGTSPNIRLYKRADNIAYEAQMSPSANITTMVDPNDPYSTKDSTVFALPTANNDISESNRIPNLRKNLNELAFFYPQLHTNDKGEVIMEFSMPEALTRWHFMALAHTQNLFIGQFDTTVITQKELMVQPYTPRFVREGDSVIINAKVSNLSGKDITVSYTASFLNAVTNGPIDKQDKPGNISLKKGESKDVSFSLYVPSGLEGITYNITAESDKFFDGEEGLIPVLPNRTLVTESLMLPIMGPGTQNFSFNSLKNYTSSPSLSPYRLKLEMTSNPAWYAVQSLPYLMEYPYECAEQVFDRYYANALSSYIATSNPRMQKVFDLWKQQGSDALISNLEKNQDVKNILLQETPWVLEAKSETEQKRRIGMLFDKNTVNNSLFSAIAKLEQMQLPEGAWPWFSGMQPDRYMTEYILEGMGHLEALGVKTDFNDRLRNMAAKALPYLDEQMANDYKELKADKAKMDDDHLTPIIVSYLYTRAFFNDIPLDKSYQDEYNYWKGQAEKYWLNQALMQKAQLVSFFSRTGNAQQADKIITSMREYALHSPEMGMYWKANNGGFYWYENSIQTQAALVEAFHSVGANKEVEEMKTWLLKQKQTQAWSTTTATADACYALLATGKDWLSSTEPVQVYLGNMLVSQKTDAQPEAGTGYYTQSWTNSEIKPQMGDIKVVKKDSGIAWGALYFQYYQDMDKIQGAGKELQIVKKVYLKETTQNGAQLKPLTNGAGLKVGDMVTIRFEIRTDRNLEYVHLKDQRAASLEPIENISGYRFSGGLGYYQAIKDASMNFFFDRLPKGTYVLEYNLRVSQAGNFSNGIAELQCMYAPEFSAHSEGIRLQVQR